MAIPTNKDELRQAIIEGYAKLKIDLASIPPEMAIIQELEGHSKGTLMSIHNRVANAVKFREL